ncbi:MAG: hypothetical protein AAFV80_21020 [Bacteroidota bacterium]
MRLLLFIAAMFGLFLLSLPGEPEATISEFCKKEEQPIIRLHLEDCFTSLGISGQEFRINDQAHFEALEWIPVTSEYCSYDALPQLDFTNYTLLGQRTATHCPDAISRKVIKKENGNLLYQITITGNQDCTNLHIDKNWILIPKVEEDVEVEFAVVKQSLDRA